MLGGQDLLQRSRAIRGIPDEGLPGPARAAVAVSAGQRAVPIEGQHVAGVVRIAAGQERDGRRNCRILPDHRLETVAIVVMALAAEGSPITRHGPRNGLGRRAGRTHQRIERRARRPACQGHRIASPARRRRTRVLVLPAAIAVVRHRPEIGVVMPVGRQDGQTGRRGALVVQAGLAAVAIATGKRAARNPQIAGTVGPQATDRPFTRAARPGQRAERADSGRVAVPAVGPTAAPVRIDGHHDLTLVDPHPHAAARGGPRGQAEHAQPLGRRPDHRLPAALARRDGSIGTQPVDRAVRGP